MFMAHGKFRLTGWKSHKTLVGHAQQGVTPFVLPERIGGHVATFAPMSTDCPADDGRRPRLFIKVRYIQEKKRLKKPGILFRD